MPIFGSDGGFQANNRGGVIDAQGNTIVSADTSFGASPLGVAARTQALFGVPNANFNLTPPDPSSPIAANSNDLPYWTIDNVSDGVMKATSVFDATTQTWGVELNPGTAANGSTLTLSTRSYLLNDDNLSLRQKALAVLSKSGTAGTATSQWNLQLSAIYYDATNTALSTAVIGTALDTGTWTSFAGTTTVGGSAISASAQYVDLAFTLTATANITGTAKATVKSLILSTSSAANASFQVAEVYTSNATWTRPVGVNYVSLVMCGGGGGGAGGAGTAFRGAGGGTAGTTGAGGGGASRVYIVNDVYVNAATYSIGIGAGGSGGTATTVTSPAGGANSPVGNGFTAGSNGGATSFGSLVTVNGGTAATSRTGGAGATATTTLFYGGTDSAAYDGAAGGSGTAVASRDAGAAGAGFTNTYIVGYQTAAGTGVAGGTATTSGAGGTADAGAAGGAGTGWIGAGGAAGYTYSAGGAAANIVGNSSAGGGGAGGGGASAAMRTSTAGTYVVTGGAGGNAAANSGAGGGGGGGYAWASGNSTSSATALTLTAGKGGNGADGFVVVLTVR